MSTPLTPAEEAALRELAQRSAEPGDFAGTVGRLLATLDAAREKMRALIRAFDAATDALDAEGDRRVTGYGAASIEGAARERAVYWYTVNRRTDVAHAFYDDGTTGDYLVALCGVGPAYMTTDGTATRCKLCVARVAEAGLA